MTRLLLLFLLACSATAAAQLNTTLRDNLPYNDGVNDVWGYVAPDGTEYAIVGLLNGVSFVSLADPDNLVEVARIPGDFSRWRDMKTFGTYAYSVADESNSTEGITAFDLSDLPNSVSFSRNTYDVPGSSSRFSRAHNIFIDESTGVLFTAGGAGSVNGGGILMFRLDSTPMAPQLIGQGPSIYAHDVTVLNDTMYASEIFAGDLSIYDISNLDTITLLGRTQTPFDFTHNAWATDDGRYIYTTDEKANAPVASYDISDKGDLKLLDEYRPAGSLNNGAIPHNAHVIGNYVSISYYTDGLRVIDATCPDNLVEVANYDTWLGPDGDFNGAWGAYPYLPSGLTLISDRQTGLYVVEVDYKFAAKMEGFITAADDGFPINNVEVILSGPQENFERTGLLGGYKTGLANGGTYQVTLTHPEYLPLTVEVNLTNGEILRLDTTLTRATERIDVGVTVSDAVTGNPISGGVVEIVGQFTTVDAFTNDQGGLDDVSLLGNETYQATFTAWGYQAVQLTDLTAADLADLPIQLTPGYEDNFITDLGWQVTSRADDGNWEIAEPIGTGSNGNQGSPAADAPNDLGTRAYVTGNGGGGVGNDDVDNGTVTLESPSFTALDANSNELTVHYSYYFANFGGTTTPNDALTISLQDGRGDATQAIEVRNYTTSTNGWVEDSFSVFDFTDDISSLKLIVSTSDLEGSGHVVEAGIDRFFVTESFVVSTSVVASPDVEANVYPNPAAGPFTVAYNAPKAGSLTLRVSNANGRVLSEQRLVATSGNVRFGEALPSGFYLIELLDNNQRVWVSKAVKR